MLSHIRIIFLKGNGKSQNFLSSQQSPIILVLPPETDVPDTDTKVGNVANEGLVGFTAEAAAIAAAADIVVELPFNGVPDTK